MQRSRRSFHFGYPELRLAAGLLGGICALSVAQAAVPPELAAVVSPDSASSRAEDFDLTLDGRPAAVLSVDQLAPSPGGVPWEVLVYFDTPLSTPDGLAAAIDTLKAAAEPLVGLGPVSIVVADPEPRELVTGVRHAHEVREGLALLEDRTTLAGELIWRRLRHLHATPSGEPAGGSAQAAMEREERLLDRQRTALDRRLRERPTAGGPGLLILVQDGFDLDFKRFYLRRTERLETLDSDLDEAHAALCRTAAAAGWTVVSLSLGKQGSELSDPRRPLRELTEATGGELVLEPSALQSTLASLEGRVRLTYRAEVGPEPARLTVRQGGRELGAPGWAGSVESALESAPPAPVASGEVIRLLPPAAHDGSATTRLTAITGGHRVGYVAFFQDGFLVDVAHQPPFQTRIELGVAPSTVRAIAFSPEALELGADTLVLNEPDRPFRVEIVEVRGEPRLGRVELDAAISTPAGRTLERVDVFWNGELRDSFEAPGGVERLTARVDTTPPRPTDHYRVVAHLDDGTSLETARLATERGDPDRLDVNLVEIYATVADRRHGPLDHLTRDDFTLVHEGRPHPVSGFARAQEVPLTLGLAVDTSESMSDWQDDLREAAAVFFESALRDGDQAFLTDFDERARLTQSPTRRRELLVGRMAALDFGGHTSLYDAILFSVMQFEGESGRKALVVLSDGDDYGSSFRPERCIVEARRLGVPVYMVVLEDAGRPLDDIDRLVHQRLARQTGGQVYFFSSPERLASIYEEIEADLRSQYLLTYATERPLTAADLGAIRVEVSDPRLTVRTILGQTVRAR